MSTLNTTNIKHPSSASNNIVLDSSARVLVGTSTARSNFFNSTFAPRLQIEGTDYSSSMASLICNSAGENAYLVLGRSKGTTIGSNTLLSADDLLGAITFQGSDGSEFCEGANIRAFVDGTPGANDMPSRLVFSTTPDASATPVERLRIDSDGFLKAPVVYSATTASAANVNVDTSGYLQRSTSSIKYKTNIETIQDSFSDAILGCRPVWYRSTAGKDNPEWGWWGFIAEEVAEVDPRLVHWKTTEPVIQENGSIENVPCQPEPEGVQYERFVPHLLNLIKRQQQAIETLEAKVAALESA